VRRFDADYLHYTREGLWTDREPLGPLDLADCERVLDVGCGTGVLTRVLREETAGTVIGLDRDPALLAHVESPAVRGDARRLPLPDDAVDLVVCQALLVNLPDPEATLAEFRRVASERVAAIEPDNGAVEVTSTVPAERHLAERAREYFIAGAETDVTLGAAAELFEAVGLANVSTRRHDHEQVIAPPYDESAYRAARRKASGAALAERRETLAAGADTTALDELREEWRAMGRAVIDAMAAESYERREVVPFYVTVGDV
jgi:SAM-dependent methyltransferase